MRSTRRHEPENAGLVMSFNVQSEVGELRQVIAHRPGLELCRLTPQNIRELLFDNVTVSTVRPLPS